MRVQILHLVPNIKMNVNYKHLSPEESKHYKDLWDTIKFTFEKLSFNDEINSAIVSIVVDYAGREK